MKQFSKRALVACLFFFSFIILPQTSLGQSYSFSLLRDNDPVEIQTMNEGLYCLFRTSAKKAPVTVFKKVFLNEDLKCVDSLNYSIEGKARLLSSTEDEKYVVHAFYTKTKTMEKIVFIVSDHQGTIVSTFFKTASDMSRYFGRPIKKLKNVFLSFLPNSGTPGMLLVRPIFVRSVVTHGSLFSLQAEDGRELWVSNAPQLSSIQTTDKLIMGLSYSADGYTYFPSARIFWIDKSTGQVTKTIEFSQKSGRHRNISVFATNGQALMLAGSDHESYNEKDGKFFMTQYSLQGDLIFDRIDTAQRLSTKRMHLMGNTFDQNGNLVFVAESWKPDATRMIATTAATVALAILSRGAYVNTGIAGMDHKIDQINFATLSPDNGSVLTFRKFPVGPWLNYGRLLTQGEHVLIIVNNQAIHYNVSDPDKPPSLFTSLQVNESLMLTSAGPVVVNVTRRHYKLKRLN
ncbi:MAG: hypothetical protein JST43_12065 [Bacteroidetes bacterium]|nr:hypothetical protein [Bacteroidota bacterium]MBS1541379.1 hypothetical protein [Bacteroidota bacterium]